MKKVTLIPMVPGGHSPAEIQTLKDVGRFSEDLGFKLLYLYFPSLSKPEVFLNRGLENLSKISRLRGDVLLIPYPGPFRFADPKYIAHLKARAMSVIVTSYLRMLISVMKKFENVILYVYDLPNEQNASVSRKYFTGANAYLAEELIFSNANKILVFNREMEKVIRKRYSIEKDKFVHYEILDMGITINPVSRLTPNSPRRIIYAANLSPNRVKGIEKYVQKLPPNVRLLLFGPNGSWIKGERVDYRGVLAAKVFYKAISEDGDFGLVWYPENVSFYFRMSSSSKFSTYLVSGLPVLVDRHAKWPAELVKKYKVGITSYRLDKLLIEAGRLDHQEYIQLKRNAIFLGKKIRKGYFIKRALIKAIVGMHK